MSNALKGEPLVRWPRDINARFRHDNLHLTAVSANVDAPETLAETVTRFRETLPLMSAQTAVD